MADDSIPTKDISNNAIKNLTSEGMIKFNKSSGWVIYETTSLKSNLGLLLFIYLCSLSG